MSSSTARSPASTTNGESPTAPSSGAVSRAHTCPLLLLARSPGSWDMHGCACLLCSDQLCRGRGRCRVLFLMEPVSLCHSLSPYIIGTTNQPVKMTPNHGLHLSFRWELYIPGHHPRGIGGGQRPLLLPLGSPGDTSCDWGPWWGPSPRPVPAIPEGPDAPTSGPCSVGVLGGPLGVLGSRAACVETQP